LLTAWRYMVKPRVPRLSREHSGDTSERAPERGGAGRGAAQPGATASRAPGSVLSRALVWRRVCIGTILGLVLANVLRAVLWTFLTGPSLTIYAATVGLSAVLSVVVGAVLGAIIGAIAAAAAPARCTFNARRSRRRSGAGICCLSEFVSQRIDKVWSAEVVPGAAERGGKYALVRQGEFFGALGSQQHARTKLRNPQEGGP